MKFAFESLPAPSKQRTYGVVFLPLVSALLILLNTGCGPLPRDPENTLNRIGQEHEMRVGLVESPPWVIRQSGEPAGVEVELVRDFAGSLGAHPKWFWGSEQNHMEALERFELDVVVSGLDATTPWSKRVGLTRPYFEEQFAVGVPPGAPLPGTLHGLNVAVHEGEATAAYLAKKGATPVRLQNTGNVKEPLAAPAWLLDENGFVATRFVLFKRKHVIAVPPGENGWLKRLQEFLEGQKSGLRDLIRRQVQP